MSERIRFRLNDIKHAIEAIYELLDGKTFEILSSDKNTRAAFERFLEIISEASRHVPDEWKAADAPQIPWRSIANIGNHIRHAYQRVELLTLWQVYEDDLASLEAAVDDMLAKHGDDH